jgi:phosphate transport system substrate-binding protein
MFSLMTRLSVVTVALHLLVNMPTNVTISQAGQTDNVVRVSGPDSMMGRGRVLAKVFMNSHPAIKVDFVQKGLVDAGISALLNRKAQIAMASRKLKGDEEELAVKNGMELTERLVGYGGILIVTNPANGVNELTVNQVKNIFTGACTRWNEVGGKDEFIEVVRQDATNHPGTLVFFQDEVLGGTPFTSKALTVSTFPAVIHEVAQIPGSIGYVRARDALEAPDADKDKVKILKIKRSPAFAGVAPSRETIADGSYALRRPYYLYHENALGSDADKFAEFVIKRGWGRQEM